MTRRLAIVALFALAAAIAGCSRAKKDAPAPPAVAARVVSMSPSTTETLYAIGAGSQLVGRSRYCDFPPEALALPQVGGYLDVSLEAVLALRPDLVTGARGPAASKVGDALATRGVPTYFPETESLAAIDAMIRGLGERTGHAKEAEREVARIDARIDEIARAVSWLPKVRVLFVFGLEPIVVAGPRSFPDEVLAKAGAANVITEGSGWPVLGIEKVLALDPDVILDAAIGEQNGHERITMDAPGWREASAVKRGRVVTLADEVVLRPGPRIDRGVETIARALHPDAKLP